MSDIEYSVITSDVIKSFDCTKRLRYNNDCMTLIMAEISDKDSLEKVHVIPKGQRICCN